MSLNEFLVVLVGLIGGWAIVSLVISARPPKSPDREGKEWFDILGVTSDASPEQIAKAYKEKCHELRNRQLRIMTTSEQAQATRDQASLESAYSNSERQL